MEPSATLGVRQQMLVASRVAALHRRALLQLPNVLQVTVGVRLRDGLRTTEPCVTVLVERKWSDRRRRVGAIPGSLPARARVRGHMRAVNVPVDVVQRVRGRLNVGTAGDGIQIRHPAWTGEHPPTGTVACVVRERGRPDAPPRLLSCHHVLALTSSWRMPAFAAFADYRVQLRGRSRVEGALALLPGNFRRMDAALASLSDTSAWSNDPRLTGILPQLSAATVPFDYRLLSANTGQEVPAHFVRFESDYSQGGYEASSVVCRFRRVLVSECATSPGDSGAPLVSARGKLIAMHFAGEGRFSFALPIEDVLDAFSPTQVLA
mgnify:CR=1 FL=1